MWNPDQPRPHSGDDDAPQEGLPMATLEWVWNSIGIRYGHFFAGKWDGFELAMVKEDWRYQLGGLTDAQLQFGLDNLPVGRPPADVQEFRAICLRAPAETPKLALPAKRGKVEIPPDVRTEFDRLRPHDDDEPLVVRAARESVATLEAKTFLSDVHKGVLSAARRVVARYEAGQKNKREEQGNAVPPATEPAATQR
jgi:hypothetical protein